MGDKLIPKGKTLECSTKGDRRFSALVANVKVGTEIKTIEEHYQLSKRFKVYEDIFIPKTLKDAKGKKDVVYFEVLGKRYEPKYLTAYYSLLWIKYLDQNPSLVEYASGFDDFTDMFKGKSINSQADIIKIYIKEGRNVLLGNALTKEFIKLMKQSHSVREVVGDLLKSEMDIIGHQTNCQGVMGSGIALSIKNLYPEIFQPYSSLCEKHYEGQGLMGRCQIVSEKGNIMTLQSSQIKKDGQLIANLFGQNNFGSGLQTQYVHLKTALVELRTFCKEHSLWVGIPYKMGCDRGGGDWTIVQAMIEEVFANYPITIYKLP